LAQKKIEAQVEVPMEFDLSSCFAQNSPNLLRGNRYQLFAFANHLSQNNRFVFHRITILHCAELKMCIHVSSYRRGTSGHYVSYARPNDTDKWFMFDDLSVASLDRSVDITKKAKDAYLLFFRRESPRRQHLQGLNMKFFAPSPGSWFQATERSQDIANEVAEFDVASEGIDTREPHNPTSYFSSVSELLKGIGTDRIHKMENIDVWNSCNEMVSYWNIARSNGSIFDDMEAPFFSHFFRTHGGALLKFIRLRKQAECIRHILLHFEIRQSAMPVHENKTNVFEALREGLDAALPGFQVDQYQQFIEDQKSWSRDPEEFEPEMISGGLYECRAVAEFFKCDIFIFSFDTGAHATTISGRESFVRDVVYDFLEDVEVENTTARVFLLHTSGFFNVLSPKNAEYKHPTNHSDVDGKIYEYSNTYSRHFHELSFFLRLFERVASAEFSDSFLAQLLSAQTQGSPIKILKQLFRTTTFGQANAEIFSLSDLFVENIWKPISSQLVSLDCVSEVFKLMGLSEHQELLLLYQHNISCAIQKAFSSKPSQFDMALAWDCLSSTTGDAKGYPFFSSGKKGKPTDYARLSISILDQLCIDMIQTDPTQTLNVWQGTHVSLLLQLESKRGKVSKFFKRQSSSKESKPASLEYYAKEFKGILPTCLCLYGTLLASDVDLLNRTQPPLSFVPATTRIEKHSASAAQSDSHISPEMRCEPIFVEDLKLHLMTDGDAGFFSNMLSDWEYKCCCGQTEKKQGGPKQEDKEAEAPSIPIDDRESSGECDKLEECCCGLRSLSFSCAFSPHTWMLLNEKAILSRHSTLTRLDILSFEDRLHCDYSYRRENPDGYFHRAKQGSASFQHESLVSPETRLQMRDCYIISTISNWLTGLTDLKHLHLSITGLFDGCSHFEEEAHQTDSRFSSVLCRAIEKLTNLEYLSVDIKFSAPEIFFALRNHSNLHHLHIAFDEPHIYSVLKHEQGFVYSASVISFLGLSIFETMRRYEMLGEILQKNQNLRSLTLRDSHTFSRRALPIQRNCDLSHCHYMPELPHLTSLKLQLYFMDLQEQDYSLLPPSTTNLKNMTSLEQFVLEDISESDDHKYWNEPVMSQKISKLFFESVACLSKLRELRLRVSLDVSCIESFPGMFSNVKELAIFQLFVAVYDDEFKKSNIYEFSSRLLHSMQDLEKLATLNVDCFRIYGGNYKPTSKPHIGENGKTNADNLLNLVQIVRSKEWQNLFKVMPPDEYTRAMPFYEPCVPHYAERQHSVSLLSIQKFLHVVSLEGHTTLRRSRILIVGPSNVGKTFLMRAMQFPNDLPRISPHKSTVGLHIQSEMLTLDENLNCWSKRTGSDGGTEWNCLGHEHVFKESPPKIQCELLDCAGQEIYYLSHTVHFTKQCLFLVVWKKQQTVDESVKGLISWLELMSTNVPFARIILVGTHKPHPPDPEYELHAIQVRDKVAGTILTLNSRFSREKNYMETQLQILISQFKSNVLSFGLGFKKIFYSQESTSSGFRAQMKEHFFDSIHRFPYKGSFSSLSSFQIAFDIFQSDLNFLQGFDKDMLSSSQTSDFIRKQMKSLQMLCHQIRMIMPIISRLELFGHAFTMIADLEVDSMTEIKSSYEQKVKGNLHLCDVCTVDSVSDPESIRELLSRMACVLIESEGKFFTSASKVHRWDEVPVGWVTGLERIQRLANLNPAVGRCILNQSQVLKLFFDDAPRDFPEPPQSCKTKDMAWDMIQFWNQVGALYVFDSKVVLFPQLLADLIAPLLHHNPTLMVEDQHFVHDNVLSDKKCRTEFCENVQKLQKTATFNLSLLKYLRAWSPSGVSETASNSVAVDNQKAFLNFLASCKLVCDVGHMYNEQQQQQQHALYTVSPRFRAMKLDSYTQSGFDALQENSPFNIFYALSVYHAGYVSQLHSRFVQAHNDCKWVQCSDLVIIGGCKSSTREDDDDLIVQDTAIVDKATEVLILTLAGQTNNAKRCSISIFRDASELKRHAVVVDDMLPDFKNGSDPKKQDPNCLIHITSNHFGLFLFALRHVDDLFHNRPTPSGYFGEAESFLFPTNFACIRLSSDLMNRNPLRKIFRKCAHEDISVSKELPEGQDVFPQNIFRINQVFPDRSFDVVLSAEGQSESVRIVLEKIASVIERRSPFAVWIKQKQIDSISIPKGDANLPKRCQLIDMYFRRASLFIVCLTPNYLFDDECLHELEFAIKICEETSKKLMVLPLHPLFCQQEIRNRIIAPERITTWNTYTGGYHAVPLCARAVTLLVKLLDMKKSPFLQVDASLVIHGIYDALGMKGRECVPSKVTSFFVNLMSNDYQFVREAMFCGECIISPPVVRTEVPKRSIDFAFLYPKCQQRGLLSKATPLFFLGATDDEIIALVDFPNEKDNTVMRTQVANETDTKYFLYFLRQMNLDFAAESTEVASDSAADESFKEWFMKKDRKIICRVEGSSDCLFFEAFFHIMKGKFAGSPFTRHSDLAAYLFHFVDVAGLQMQIKTCNSSAAKPDPFFNYRMKNRAELIVLVEKLDVLINATNACVVFDVADSDLIIQLKQPGNVRLIAMHWKFGRALENYLLPLTTPLYVFLHNNQNACELTCEVLETLSQNFFPLAPSCDINKACKTVGVGWLCKGVFKLQDFESASRESATKVLIPGMDAFKAVSTRILDIARSLVAKCQQHESDYQQAARDYVVFFSVFKQMSISHAHCDLYKKHLAALLTIYASQQNQAFVNITKDHIYALVYSLGEGFRQYAQIAKDCWTSSISVPDFCNNTFLQKLFTEKIGMSKDSPEPAKIAKDSKEIAKAFKKWNEEKGRICGIGVGSGGDSGIEGGGSAGAEMSTSILFQEKHFWSSLPMFSSFLAHMCVLKSVNQGQDDFANYRVSACRILSLFQHSLCIFFNISVNEPSKSIRPNKILLRADENCVSSYMPCMVMWEKKGEPTCLSCGHFRKFHYFHGHNPAEQQGLFDNDEFASALCLFGSVGWKSHDYMGEVHTTETLISIPLSSDGQVQDRESFENCCSVYRNHFTYACEKVDFDCTVDCDLCQKYFMKSSGEHARIISERIKKPSLQSVIQLLIQQRREELEDLVKLFLDAKSPPSQVPQGQNYQEQECLPADQGEDSSPDGSMKLEGDSNDELKLQIIGTLPKGTNGPLEFRNKDKQLRCGVKVLQGMLSMGSQVKVESGETRIWTDDILIAGTDGKIVSIDSSRKEEAKTFKVGECVCLHIDFRFKLTIGAPTPPPQQQQQQQQQNDVSVDPANFVGISTAASDAAIIQRFLMAITASTSSTATLMNAEVAKLADVLSEHEESLVPYAAIIHSALGITSLADFSELTAQDIISAPGIPCLQRKKLLKLGKANGLCET
jgi:GTPase SAR1 family protein